MNQPGDYCITYNGALVQKAADGSTVAQTALNYDDYLFWKNCPVKSGLTSTRSIVQRSTPLTATSAITPCTNRMSPPFRWCSVKQKNGSEHSVPESDDDR